VRDRNLEPVLAQQAHEILLVCRGLAAGSMKLEANCSDEVQLLLDRVHHFRLRSLDVELEIVDRSREVVGQRNRVHEDRLC